jgi:DNA-directed RNA polymerase alpha subunit
VEITLDIKIDGEGELKGEPNDVFDRVAKLREILNNSGIKTWSLTIARQAFTGHADAVGAALETATFAEPTLPTSEILVETLDLGSRAYNHLKRSGINTVGELISNSPQEIKAIPNLGPTILSEIKEVLSALGLSLKQDDEKGK